LGLGLGPAGEAAAHLALVGSEPRGAAPAAPAAGPPLADASEVDEPPVPVGPRTVRYPPHAEAMQLEGRVRIEVILSAAGLVESARVLDADPPGVFDAQALVDVLGWTFRPATRQGQPVRCRATTELVYALR
jgi:protein TonB